MRVLLFSHAENVLPGASRSVYCGWIGSLLETLRSHSDVEIGVAAFSRSFAGKCVADGVCFYGMHHDASWKSKAIRLFDLSARDASDLDSCRRVVDDFRPDIVHVFGTEGPFGLLAPELPVPLAVHLQGLLGPYLNAWYPPGYSYRDMLFRTGLRPDRVLRQWWAWRFNRHAAAREREILRVCRFFMGRTEWDRAFVSLNAPSAKYFHCDETLRAPFLAPGPRSPLRNPVRLVSTLSSPLYKGHDVVLKAARALKRIPSFDFEWRVFGTSGMGFAERKTGISANAVGVRACGPVDAGTLRGELLSATAYVHPSYIDNSPNGVCEAQVLGVPVVATDVGGVPSIVENGKTGWLVPANDPLMMAARIADVVRGDARLPAGWENGPRLRHDPGRIVARLLDIYRDCIGGGHGGG